MATKPWQVPYEQRFAGRRPRVCIGFVAFGDIYAQVFESAMHWAFYNGAHYKGVYDVSFGVATRKEQYRARNALVDQARESNADFLLMLDDDHMLADCPDMIDIFFKEEKPLQGGLYVQRTQEKEQPVVCKHAGGDKYRWCSWDEIPAYPGGVVDVLGGGVNWCDVTMFDFMQQPHWWPYPSDRREVTFLPHEKFGLDLQLCIAAQKMGIEPWLNRKVRLGHVMTERFVLRPDNQQPQVRCTICGGLASYEKEQWTCMTCQSVMIAA